MFGKKKTSKWSYAKEQYKNGKIDAQVFVNMMKDTVLYYSTPMGNDKDGNPHLYILSKHETGKNYYPAFLSQNNCTQFFTRSGRKEFMIMQGNLGEFLSSLDAHPMLAELGAVIEPSFLDETDIPPGIRVR